MDAFDLEGCMNLLGHSLQAKGLIACRGRKKLLHAVGGDLSQIGQIEQFITGKISQRQRLSEILTEQPYKLLDTRDRIFILHPIQLEQMLV